MLAYELKRSEERHRVFIAPIIVPSTPNSELLQILKEVAEQEAVPGLKFKVLERGGLTVQHKVQKSNPSATPGCQDADCLPCKDGRGKGGSCRRGNVQYQMECQVCNVTDIQTGRTDQTVYIGETSRNGTSTPGQRSTSTSINLTMGNPT